MKPFEGLLAADEKWYCLRSKTTGLLITDGVDDAGVMCGHVLVFFDQEDAERAAVAHRESYPALAVEAVPLPARKGFVARQPDVHKRELIAVHIPLALGEESLVVEIRPDSGTPTTTLVPLVIRMFEKLVDHQDKFGPVRVGPQRILELGLRPATAATDNPEAA